jgi:carbon-monoxide dehydrogenase medium subunit|tara:strand:- start:3260 stop:4138 length:879 start_codon:yes stop_codon:yes gene_type:complete
MKNFDYHKPSSLDEVVNILERTDQQISFLAGGTDLVVAMRNRRLQPEVLIDIKCVEEMNELSFDDDSMTLGASVTCHTVRNDSRVSKFFPALVDCSRLIGGIQIQGRATIGGNLCNAAPSADAIPSLIVLNAIARIRGLVGFREVPVENFIIAPGQTVLEPKEVLVSLRIPLPGNGEGARYLRFTPRNDMDIAVASAAVKVIVSDSGDEFLDGRVAIGAVAPTPLYVQAATQELSGQPVSDVVVARVAAMAREAAQPISDMRGTADQRRHLTEILVRRALNSALDRATGAKS